MLEWLCGGEGPGADEIEPGLRWHNFWQQHGDDPELLELEEARAVAFSGYMDADGEGERDRLAEPFRAADDAYEVHVVKLMRDYKPTVRLTSVPQLGKRGEALATVSDRGHLFARYRDVDMEMRVFEDTLVDVVIGWDRAVEAESERRHTSMMVS